jgi:hypothetical protein
MNPYNILNILTKEVRNKYEYKFSQTTKSEKEFANKLFEILAEVSENNNFNISENETLDTVESDDYLDQNIDQIICDNDPDFDINEENSGFLIENKFIELEKMKKVIEYSKNHKFSSVQKNFRFVKHPIYITRFKEYIDKMGTNREKLFKVQTQTYDMFKNARINLLPVHDIDIKRWSLKIAKTLNLNNFKASNSWINKFKITYRIRSRKVTKFETRSSFENEEALKQKAKDFVRNSLEIIKDYPEDHIFNTDQTGFNYEMHSNRTLSYIGESNTSLLIKSRYATSHSYTVQPTISLDGELHPILYLCLKEKNGTFGPIVYQNLFKAPNVIVTCSSSGKLHKQHVIKYCNDVLKNNISSDFVLLLDSWCGQTDEKVYTEIFSNENKCLKLQIPGGVTKYIQPLDRVAFLQYKYFIKCFYNRAILDCIDINLNDRNNIIKMHSLVHNQLYSEKFKPMFKLSWYECGYISEEPLNYKNVRDICFSKIEEICCVNNCNLLSFICCSWCDNNFCFEHFFVRYHIHFDDILDLMSE